LTSIVETLMGQTIAHGYLVAHLLAAHAKKSDLPENELKRISDAANATLTVMPFGGGGWSVDRITQAAQNEIDGVMGLSQALMRPKR
jgi:hypothetical protein